MTKKKWIYLLITIIIICAIAGIVRYEKSSSLWPQDIFQQSDDIDFNKLATTSVAFRLDLVLEQAGDRPDLDIYEQRDFDIYLERPEQNLKQPEQINGDVYTVDLQPELRPVRLLISETDDHARDSGNSCQIAGFPHRCMLNLSAKEQGKPKTVLVKVVFADKFYAEKEITIPYVGMLKNPIIVQPKITPQNNETMHLKFKDVGAQQYDISINVCRPYQDDGINPCLKSVSYTISRMDDVFILSDNALDLGIVNVQNGIVDIILPDKFIFDYDDTSVVYNIDASFSGETDNGIYTYLSSRAELELEINP